MEYDIVRGEDDELTVFIPHDELFRESYNPDGYDTIPDVEIIFQNTEEKEAATAMQVRTLEYLLENSYELSNLVSNYLIEKREAFIEIGVPKEVFKSPKSHYRFSRLFVEDDYKDNFAYVGFAGECSWDGEHGFGVVFLENKIVDVGDWNDAYTIYTSIKKRDFSIEEKFSLSQLFEYKKEVLALESDISKEAIADHSSLLDWLIGLESIYGYRDTEVDLTELQVVSLIRSIKKLDLSNRDLNAIHEKFSLLQNLVSLNLSNNNLEEVPESVLGISNIERLILSNNKLSQIPESFGNLTKLTGIDFSSNRISRLPNSLERLTAVASLSLAYNKFETVPEEVKFLKKLQIINVNGNEIKELPEWIGEFRELTTLNLVKNRLIGLPSTIADLPKLIHLRLDYNNIRSLPEKLGSNDKPASLRVKHNNLSSLPADSLKIRSLNVFQNEIAEEDLQDYVEWRKENLEFCDDDLRSEISRLRQERRSVNVVSVSSETSNSDNNSNKKLSSVKDIKGDTKYVDDSKNEKGSSCIVLLVIFLFLSLVSIAILFVLRMIV